MKNLIPITLAATFVASGISSAQTPAYSKPSGYVTQQLQTGFNLVGLTLHSAPSASGRITALSTTRLSDSSLNFVAQASSIYLLEITSGLGAGLVQEIASTSISTGGINLVQAFPAVAVGDSYLLRKAPTLEETFGTTNSFLQKGATAGAADLIWVPNGSSGYDRYFLNTFDAWRNAAGGAALNTPIVYLDGFFIQRKGAPTSFTVTGQVKTNGVSLNITSGFNLVGSAYPVGSTLQNLGFDRTVQKGATAGASDLIWVPKSSGGYDRYFLNTFDAWRNAEGGAATADLPITSAVFLQRKGGSANLTLAPPSAYGSL